MTRSFRRDSAGIAKILKSAAVARAVHRAAEQIATSVRAQPTVARHGARVKVDDYTTDRAASSVTIAHPGGRAMQAKHGALTRGASGAGYKVRRRR